MKFYFNIPNTLRPFYNAELSLAQNLLHEGKLQQCWRHYERAHIIGQRYPIQHSYVHWLMQKFGFKIKSIKEILGQIPRLIFGGVKSFGGTVPIGNTGGANVPPLKPMVIPKDLQDIIDKHGANDN
jgi:hypothetical protein